MAAYIKTLKDASRENIIYPRTKSEAVYRDDNTTSVEEALVALESEVTSILENGISSDDYETKVDAQAKLDEAKAYTDEQIAALGATGGSVNADWSQNDVNGEGYIENRTHYDGRYTVKTEDVTINGVTGPYGFMKIADIPLDFDFSKIVAYTLVSNNGANFIDEPVEVENYNGCLIAGPFALIDSYDYIGDIIPPEFSDLGLYTYMSDEEGDNVSFYYNFTLESGELVQLDSKYIKDMYEDNSGEKEIVPHQSITVDDENPYGFLFNNYVIEEYRSYKVVIDGDEYVRSAYKIESNGYQFLYLGNPYLFNPDEYLDNGDQFIIFYNISVNEFYSLFTEVGSHSVSVTGYAEDIKKLDIKYDPTLEKNLKVIFSSDKIYEYYSSNLETVSALITGNCYVTFDGTTEKVNFVDTGWSTEAIGTGYSLETATNDEDDITLTIYCDDGDNAHSIIIKQDIYTIKKELLPVDVVKAPNWNQNDENGVGYIKNKPFYEEIIDESIIIPEFTYSISEKRAVKISSSSKLYKEKTYCVTFDGVEYQRKAWPWDSNGVSIGNIAAAGSNTANEDEDPFLLINYGDGSVYLHSMEVGEHTIEVKIIEQRIVNYIDNKFIKDMYYEQYGNDVVLSNLSVKKGRRIYPEGPINIGDTFLVNFDGAEYECEAIRHNNVSNAFSIGSDAKDYSVYPFSIHFCYMADEEDPFTVVFYCNDDKSHTIHVIKTSYSINKINPKYIEDMYYTELGTEVLIPNTTFYGRTSSFPPCELIENESYIVIFNDTEYNTTCYIKDGLSAIGAEFNKDNLGNMTFDWSTYPFSLILKPSDSDGKLCCDVYANNYKEIYTISVIKKGEEIVHKIDSKYLPDDIGGVTSWNDLTDRPFGSEFTRELILETSQIPMVSNDYYAGVKWGQYAGNDIVIHGDRQYLIVWNGTEYRCDIAYLNGTLSIGNPSIVNLGDNTGEPFLIAVLNPQNILIYTNEDIESVDLKIYEEAESIKTIDSKYLPSGGCADWNEADENQNDYIKNRPFYENKEMVSIFKKHFESNNAIGDGGVLDDIVPIDPGQKYTVVIDGAEFKDIIFDSLVFANGQSLGASMGRANYDGNGNTLTFYIYSRLPYGTVQDAVGPYHGICLNVSVYDSNNNYIELNDFDVEIFCEQVVDIKQTSGKFIEDGYYEEINETILIDTTSERQNTRGFSNWYSDYVKIDIEKDYIVVFDGVTYGPCKFQLVGENNFYIGNPSLGDIKYTNPNVEDNGCPFGVETVASYHGDDNGNNWWTYGPVIYFDLDDGINHHLILKEVGEPIVHKIDPKYLPESKGTSRLIDGQFYGSIRHIDAMPSNGEEFGKEDYYLGYNAIALGPRSQASGNNSFAIGYETHAEGLCSIAEGTRTFAIGEESHAEGWETQAIGNRSHSEGNSTIAEGNNSHAEGFQTTSVGENSHAEGIKTQAIGENSHAEGYYTTANASYQHVQGKYNIPDDISAHIVGNGTYSDSLSNAHTLDWSGNAWFAGDVYVGSTSGTNKDDGSKRLATVEYVDTSISTIAPDSIGAAKTSHTHSANDLILTDTSTGTQYKLSVTDGKLTLSTI